VTQFSGCNEYRLKQLMHLQVSHLSIMEDFTDIVHMSLDGPDPPEGVWCIYLHGFRTRGLLAPRVRKGSRELGPGGLLVDGARISFWELGLSDGVGPITKFWGWEGLHSFWLCVLMLF
jgi:hypothetical protein